MAIRYVYLGTLFKALYSTIYVGSFWDPLFSETRGISKAMNFLRPAEAGIKPGTHGLKDMCASEYAKRGPLRQVC